MGLRVRLVGGFVMLVALAAAPLLASGQSGQHVFSHPDFVQVWDRTDLPVQQGQVNRTWMWGPGANTPLMDEPYAEADGGMRSVQYTDKSRMELPVHPVEPDSDWFITQGLLATELMTGELQLGDATFEQHQPADIYVAGDPVNNQSPTYAQMGQLIDRPSRSGGQAITEKLTSDGQITTDPLLDMYGVWDQEYVAATDNYVASVFWDFMNSSGTIYQNGQYVHGPVFTNPFYAIGFPITDAYWGDVTVAGQEQEVLIQCFQRRCLTYAPLNDPGWQVESGNIGQHYYDWRYEHIDNSDDDDADDDPGTPDPQPEPGSFDALVELNAWQVGEYGAVSVKVFDGDNQPFEGAHVRARVTSTTGQQQQHLDTWLDPDPAFTNEGGVATLQYMGTEPGVDTVTIYVDGLMDTETVEFNWVDDSDGCVTEGQSIQAAIEAASPGDEVCVNPGLYQEQLSITTPNITLAAESGATLMPSPESLGGSGITVIADDVTVAGFELEGFPDLGVMVQSASDVELLHLDIQMGPDIGIQVNQSDNVGIRGASIDMGGGPLEPDGVAIFSSTDVHLQLVHITGAHVGVIAGTVPGNPATTATIEGSLFERFETGISVRDGSIVETVNTEFFDGGFALRSFGGEQNTYLFAGNDVQNSRGGVWGGSNDVAAVQNNFIAGESTGVIVSGAHSAKIDGNHFVGLFSGVRVFDDSNMAVRRNIFELNVAGVEYRGSAGSEISENLFYNNEFGVQFRVSSEADILNNRFEQNDVAILSGPDADGSLPFVTENDFIDNQSGIHVWNTSQGHSMFARFNYWGDPSGPSGEGPGSGDSITEYVDVGIQGEYWHDEVVNPQLAP